MNLFKLLFGIGGKKHVSSETISKIKQAWQQVEAALLSKSPSQLKQALITADKSLDNALRDVVAGETMGERLKNAKDNFDRATYDRIWKAHKARNALVHEAGYDPTYYVLKEEIENLKKGLIALGVHV
jgi:hypothetical protein